MNTGPDAFGIIENETTSAKYEKPDPSFKLGPRSWTRVWERETRKLDPAPSVPPKTGLRAQNMKTGPNALGTVEIESGNAK
jgi:hypothetical protein